MSMSMLALNPLAPIRYIIFKLIIQNSSLDACCEITPRWVPQNLTNGSKLVQVMAWCRQATSHYLSWCWPRSMSPSSFTRWQRVNTFSAAVQEATMSMSMLPLNVLNFFQRTHRYIFPFLYHSSTVKHHRLLRCALKDEKKMPFHMVNIMVADALATQGARALVAVIWT